MKVLQLAGRRSLTTKAYRKNRSTRKCWEELQQCRTRQRWNKRSRKMEMNKLWTYILEAFRQNWLFYKSFEPMITLHIIKYTIILGTSFETFTQFSFKILQFFKIISCLFSWSSVPTFDSVFWKIKFMSRTFLVKFKFCRFS